MATPKGELVLQTVAMPRDANAYGDIFGGWLLSQMDLGGSVLAHQKSQSRVTTVAIDQMVFIKPVYVGDLVCCFAYVERIGNTSIKIKIDVWVSRLRMEESELVAEGMFTYVALDENRRPKPVIS